MAKGIFASSKSALILAVGVIACSVLAVAGLSSRFTPDQENDYLNERSVYDEASAGTPNGVSKSQVKNQAINTRMDGFADDADLIDDTSGFDPAPASNPQPLVSSPSNDDGGFGPRASAPSSRSSTPSQGPSRSVFQDYQPSPKRTKKTRQDDLYPPDPPPGQPFPKDRKIIELVEPKGS